MTHTGYIFSSDQIATMRAMKLADEKITARQVKAKLQLHCDVASVHRVIYNLTFIDPAYTPSFSNRHNMKPEIPEGGRYPCVKCGKDKPAEAFYWNRNYHGNVKRRHQCKECLYKYRYEYKQIGKRGYRAEIKAARHASIDCKHVCPTCGMGCDSEQEALKCCERACGE